MKFAEVALETPLRDITPDDWCDECITFGDACFECAYAVEFLTD